MNIPKKLIVMTSFAVASGLTVAGEAKENELLCKSVNGTNLLKYWFVIPEAEVDNSCACVGNHSEILMRNYPRLSNVDRLEKSYHACLSGEKISSRYSSMAFAAVSGQVPDNFARSFANCMGTNAVSEGIRYATDSRPSSSFMSTVQGKCQWIINMNGWMQIFK